MEEIIKMKETSMDIVQDNIEKLKEIFPEIFSEEKIDFKVLEQLLGKNIETEKERYSFTWHGKTEARKIAQTPSTGTLIPSPDRENSKDWDNTDNLYIEGDNLEVLKLLQKSYHGKVKMIYIDPPYNTGKDFVYPDNYKDNLKNYLEITGQLGEEGQKLSTNSDANGRYHSDWLNMMYPRLKLARNLLSDEGVIFMSIDENEAHNLRKLCDEIFGEENLVGEVIWEKKFSPQNDAKYFSLNHEQIFCYAKNKNQYQRKLLPMTQDQIARYKNPDNDSRGVWQSDNLTVATYNEKYDYPITTPSGKIINPTHGYCWRVSKERLEELINENRVWFGKEGENVPRLKRFLHETQQGRVPISLWYHEEIGHTQSASQDLKKLFGDKKFFDFPKPVELVKRALQISTLDNDLILDFFSGSATTAHAVMQLNAEDGGNRKYIMVQLPEPTPESSEASKAGYKNICEIGKERIRRAGEKIRADETLPAENREKLDTGFKVFKLNSSNIKTWDPDSKDIAESLFDSINNIKSDRTSLDVLYEILLKYGLDLNIPIENRGSFYSIGGGTLLVNLDDKIEMSAIDAICQEFKFLMDIDEDHKSTVIVRDNAFKNSVDKTNAIQKMKQTGIKEIRSI